MNLFRGNLFGKLDKTHSPMISNWCWTRCIMNYVDFCMITGGKPETYHSLIDPCEGSSFFWYITKLWNSLALIWLKGRWFMYMCTGRKSHTVHIRLKLGSSTKGWKGFCYFQPYRLKAGKHWILLNTIFVTLKK